MAGLKGLKKGDRPDLESQAETFISGAKERIDALSVTPTTDKVADMIIEESNEEASSVYNVETPGKRETARDEFFL